MNEDQSLLPEASSAAPVGAASRDDLPPEPDRDAEPDGPRDLAAILEEQQVRLAAQEDEIRRLQEEVVALGQQVEDSTRRAALAVTKYRDTLLALHSDVPGELVQGDTLEAVEASFLAARQTVAAVRQHLQRQGAALRVPAGAPVRGEPDLGALSPQQKILLGLRQRRAS